ncbi:MAG: glycosyltransferase family 4 protein [Thermoanaerobacterales bacterium]|nr:glycosyltransferase family 4 protein [Thermoanaerobacterales bacterium]
MNGCSRSGNGRQVALLGTYPPRKCGIATFTEDLADALEATRPGACEVGVLAMDDTDGGYSYPQRVKFHIREGSVPDYLRAADFLNVCQVDLLAVQHEYGIFGGRCGAHLLHLLDNVRVPVVTTLHTILTEPSPHQRAILLDLARCSETVVAMSQRGKRILHEVYGLPEEQVVFIPHGIPDVAFVDPVFYKDTLGVEGRKVILSFGLMHPGKGFEVVIKALPEVIAEHPDVIYIILGATHPHVLRATGDAYRNSLHQLVNRLGLDAHVRFDNKYVDDDELLRYLLAADIFVTPYRSPAQITSGTLSYAVGAGKAVISMPYWHAEELLADGRGRLVPFDDPRAMAREINDLLENEHECNAMRKRAYQYGRRMIWCEVARRYHELFDRVLQRRRSRPRPAAREDSPAKVLDKLPPPDLKHMLAMTDDTGMLQHCAYTVPDREHGYCVDDNARALIAADLYHAVYRHKSTVPLAQKYLSFLLHAFNRERGRFRNFMSYDRRWLEEVGSEDAHGRAMWALGVTVRDAPGEALRALATRLFNDALAAVSDLTAPRAWAFTLIGLHAYLEVYSGDARARRAARMLARRLHDQFRAYTRRDWLWFEDRVTYDNATLSRALILAGRRQGERAMLEDGLASLRWLLRLQTAPEGHLSPVGNAGWCVRGGTRARFDQQPVDAMALVGACLEAFRATGDNQWMREALRALNWFLGANDLNLPLYDFTTGGCCDGLMPQGVNPNQGAESTLAWLISLLSILEVIGHKGLLDGGAEEAERQAAASD